MESAKHIKNELLQKLIPDLSDATAETLEIIMDIAQPPCISNIECGPLINSESRLGGSEDRL